MPSTGSQQRGQVLVRASERAGAAGAIAVTRRGASPSIPGLDEVHELLAGGTSA